MNDKIKKLLENAEQSFVPFVQFALVIAILTFRPRGLGGVLEDVRE